MRELSIVLRVRRPRWFGHIERRKDCEAVERAFRVEVPGCHPSTGQVKEGMQVNVEEDLAALGIGKAEAMN